MKPKVYVSGQISPAAIELLKKFCEAAVNEAEDRPASKEIIKHRSDKDGLLCLGGDRVDRALLDGPPRLKVVSTMGVGYEHIDVPEATRRGIYVDFTLGVSPRLPQILPLLSSYAARGGFQRRIGHVGFNRDYITVTPRI
jgi:glyoxylate reductase